MRMMRCWLSLVAVMAADVAVTTVTGACVNTLKCSRAPNAISLDADLSDWSAVEGIATELHMVTQTLYEDGDATIKCVYDDDTIYFAVEIPGLYRFNDTDYHQCPSIATMTKIGADATFVNMGGCPEATSGCESGFPASCDSYRVDIGAHWELNGAAPSMEHFLLETGGAIDGVTPADAYGASPFCRIDDDGDSSGNEWRASWAHSDPKDGAAGEYTFELARALSTRSTTTDAQYAPGNVYQMGIAFWDPYETPSGFTDPGHYVTGCAEGWIDLELVADSGSGSSGAADAPTGNGTSNGGADASTKNGTKTNGGGAASAAHSLTSASILAFSGLAALYVFW